MAVTRAEGLAADGNQLKIAYDPLEGFDSNTLGDLSLAGSVTIIGTSTFDMDGLGSGHSNPFGLYAVDRTPNVDTVLGGIDPVSAAATVLGTYVSTLHFSDLVTVLGEAIIIDTLTDELHRIDIITGAQLAAPTSLLLDVNYQGLALATPIVTGVESSDNLPAVTAVRSIFPNPFNPFVRIAFDLDRDRPIRITVYDLRGRIIKSVLDEVRPAGSYEMTWDGHDRGGQKVASGVYYVSVQSGDWSDRRKIVLLK